jgi:hypothetical protein
MQQQDVFVGYSEQPKVYEDSGNTSVRFSFTLAELEDLKRYATEKGRVYLTYSAGRSKKTGKDFSMIKVYDPKAPNKEVGTYAKAKGYATPAKPNAVDADDLPF